MFRVGCLEYFYCMEQFRALNNLSMIHDFIIFYHSCDFLYGTLNSSVDRRHFDAYPDPTYRFDNDPDQDPIASFTNVGKSDLFLLLFSLAYSVL